MRAAWAIVLICAGCTYDFTNEVPGVDGGEPPSSSGGGGAGQGAAGGGGAGGCADGEMNGDEQGVDCGGPSCLACDGDACRGDPCEAPAGCKSGACEGGICVASVSCKFVLENRCLQRKLVGVADAAWSAFFACYCATGCVADDAGSCAASCAFGTIDRTCACYEPCSTEIQNCLDN